MEEIFNTLLEVLNKALKKLQLENNIFGYIVVFLILTVSAAVTAITITGLVRKLKTCNKSENFAEIEIDV